MRELKLLIKPVSSACDLNCRYCFYKDEAEKRKVADHGKMTNDTMRAIVDKALAAAQTCVFGFQGGEPTLAGLSFFRAFTAYVEERKRPGQTVAFTLQTNGIRMDEEWLEFLKEKQFLTGLSLDGVRKTHDENRTDYRGDGTFTRAFACAKKLQEYRIPFHVLCVLNAQTASHIGAVYRFFIRKGLIHQQYIPCLDPLGEERGRNEYSLTPGMYEESIKTLFDLWFQDRVQGSLVYIRQFENYVDMLRGGQPEACSMYGRCSMQNVIESDGSIYPCDFYALDQYQMGNILDPSLDFETLGKLAQKEGAEGHPFFRDPARRDDRCGECRWYPLCRGGCKRDCFSADGTMKNYYCEANSRFFSYSIERLEYLAGSRF